MKGSQVALVAAALLFSLTQGLTIFSVYFQPTKSLSYPRSSAVVAGEQPQTVCPPVRVAVHSYNFTHTGCGVWPRGHSLESRPSPMRGALWVHPRLCWSHCSHLPCGALTRGCPAVVKAAASSHSTHRVLLSAAHRSFLLQLLNAKFSGSEDDLWGNQCLFLQRLAACSTFLSSTLSA